MSRPMSNPLVKKLQETLDSLRSERDRLDQQIEQFEGVLAFYDQNPERLDVRPGSSKELRNTMWDILREEGRALHFRDIYERLAERGARVAGKEPHRNVGAHLSADERFISLGSGIWGLASWPPQPPSDTVLDLSNVSGSDEANEEDWTLPSEPSAFEASREAVPLLSGMNRHHDATSRIHRDDQSSADDFDDLDDVPF
jgi:DNA-directed RNA polymerase delta subunit